MYPHHTNLELKVIYGRCRVLSVGSHHLKNTKILVEVVSVLWPTSFSTITLALSVWGKHEHLRIMFIRILIVDFYDIWPWHTFTLEPSPCARTRMHTHSNILTTLFTLKHTYTHSHTLNLHIITNPVFTHMHLYTLVHSLHTPYLRKYIYFYFWENIFSQRKYRLSQRKYIYFYF